MPTFVKPSVPGNAIPYPERSFAPLPQEGDFVPDTPYWTRRLIAGDVVEADPPAAPAEASRRRSTPAEEK